MRTRRYYARVHNPQGFIHRHRCRTLGRGQVRIVERGPAAISCQQPLRSKVVLTLCSLYNMNKVRKGAPRMWPLPRYVHPRRLAHYPELMQGYKVPPQNLSNDRLTFREMLHGFMHFMRLSFNGFLVNSAQCSELTQSLTQFMSIIFDIILPDIHPHSHPHPHPIASRQHVMSITDLRKMCLQ